MQLLRCLREAKIHITMSKLAHVNYWDIGTTNPHFRTIRKAPIVVLKCLIFMMVPCRRPTEPSRSHQVPFDQIR